MHPRRTFLGYQASRVAWVPSSSAYAASDVALVVAGRESVASGDTRSVVALLRVACRQPDDADHLSVDTTQQWRLDGAVNDLHVVSHPQSDAATVLCATSQGTVLRLRVPGDVTAAVASSTTPELWLDAAATGGCGITSLDSDMQEVVFATRTGALGIANLDRGCAAPTFLLPGGSCTSFAAVRFVSTGGGGHRAAAGGGGSHVVATVGSTPGCCLFDPFAPSTSRPALRCAGSSPAQRFRCLAVEPGTSHGALLAAGSADEAAACVWDTRQPATPLWSWSQHAGGDSAGAYCTVVAFDPGACFSSSPGEDYGHMQSLGGTTSTQRTSGLLLATSAGVLLGCTVSKGQVPLVALARESVPVAHCAIVPTSGQQLAAVTDSECLLLWDARSAGALDPMM